MRYFLTVNESLIRRGEFLKIVKSLIEDFNRRDIKRQEIFTRMAEINNTLSHFYDCHHGEEILSMISSTKESVEKVLEINDLSILP